MSYVKRFVQSIHANLLDNSFNIFNERMIKMLKKILGISNKAAGSACVRSHYECDSSGRVYDVYLDCNGKVCKRVSTPMRCN